MQKLSVPTILHSDIYEECSAGVHDVQAIELLQTVKVACMGKGREYVECARIGNVNDVLPLEIVPDIQHQLRNMYLKRMMPKRSAGRKFYDILFNSSAVCPYCGFGEITALDHYLPKDGFPELSVCPENLIPICHACNLYKSNFAPEGGGNFFFNPYFDPLPVINDWLVATLSIVNGGPVLTFSLVEGVHQAGANSPIPYHFQTLRLGERFRKRCATILREMEQQIDDLLIDLGPDDIARYFEAEAIRKSKVKSFAFEVAAYLAASNSPQFCNGGYRN